MIEVILSVGLAFLATAIAEPHFIQYMKMKQLGQTTLDEGPSWHKAKSGTPTMGGLVFLCIRPPTPGNRFINSTARSKEIPLITATAKAARTL